MNAILARMPILLVTLMISLPCSAEIYKCMSQGKTQFSDKPCAGAGETQQIQEVEQVQPKPKGKVVYLEGYKSEREAQDKLYEREPGDKRSGAEEAKDRADRIKKDWEWKRRNMSVGCMTNKYNVWVSGRSPKPTAEEAERKMDELRSECREMLHLPEDLPSIIKPSSAQNP